MNIDYCDIIPIVTPIADAVYLIEPYKLHPKFDFETKFDMGLPLINSTCKDLKYYIKYA